MRSIRCQSTMIRVLFALSVVGAPSLAMAQTTLLISQTESGPATTYSPPQYPFAVSRTDDQGIHVQIGSPSFFFGFLGYDLRFSTGAGKPLTPGTYLSATRPPAPYNGMSWDSLIIPTQHACFFQPGRFLVREAEYAPDGPVLRLAIDIEAHCLDEAAAWYGILRYNSTVPLDRFPGETVRYSLSIAPPDHGLVTGGGISCGGGQTACSTTFASASSVTLTAIPDPGFVFAGWKPGCAGEATATLFVNTVKECGAAFAKAIPSEPLTSLVLKGEQGDPVTRGENDLYSVENSRPWAEHIFTAKGEQVTVYIWGLSYLPLSPVFSLSSRWPESVLWKLSFRAPLGTPLSVGRYTNISSARYGPSNMSGLDVWGKGDCLASSPLRVGEFLINEIAFNADGSLRAFAADFEQHCVDGAAQPGLRGAVNFNSMLTVVPCGTPDPFVSLGGGTCFDGGWLPPGMPPPGTGVNPPQQPLPTGCTTPDPFTSLGGGTCANGGWFPPGMPVPGGGGTPPPPTGCTTPDPFVSLGGGTCRNGGWLPPGME